MSRTCPRQLAIDLKSMSHRRAGRVPDVQAAERIGVGRIVARGVRERVRGVRAALGRAGRTRAVVRQLAARAAGAGRRAHCALGLL